MNDFFFFPDSKNDVTARSQVVSPVFEGDCSRLSNATVRMHGIVNLGITVRSAE